MKDAQPTTVLLKDYRQPDYWIDQTDLSFELGEERTRVEAILRIRLNKQLHKIDGGNYPALILNGTELHLESIHIGDLALGTQDYSLDGEQLTIKVSDTEFELRTVCFIEPQKNTSLEGLYKSNGMFCTQCEAEGFRKITYYLDRPDVMSIFSCKITADKSLYPVLLSNGNEFERETLKNGFHSVLWRDPHKKPAYLFALVAGDLEHVRDSFTTCSGREVTLQLFTEQRNIHKCAHAIDSLKRSMRWDEEVYGREYDLDIFMIVAVDHFNMGAMENKGLNIFNSSCVLASPETATDNSFQRIEAIVAHEYFHNWSGNRVTCRDWFQLSLKEGFTVFRDSEFSADMNSRTVKRIEDVALLRTAQFAEDAGPMAHPVLPDSYMEISNFYTLTVYEKGAELVRMIHKLLGKQHFRAGSDLYFERYDGLAVTVENFVSTMEDASEMDLTQFRRWYHQAGTPVIKVTDEYDSSEQCYRLHVSQSCPATPDKKPKQPLHIPLAVGLLSSEGSDLLPDKTQMLNLTDANQSFTFEGIKEPPVPSLLRDFSAPVRLEFDYSDQQLAFLMANDTDGFNRWDAAQQLSVRVLQRMVDAVVAGEPLVVDRVLIDAYEQLLTAPVDDPAHLEATLILPSEAYIAEISDVVLVNEIHQAREYLADYLADLFKDHFNRLYNEYQLQGEYHPSADDIAARSLKNCALGYLGRAGEEGIKLAARQFDNADNMTDRFRALGVLVHGESDDAIEKAGKALDEFYQQWSEDPQVLELWLSVQASCQREGALQRVEALMKHDAFDAGNPNKLRSLIGVFCSQNTTGFHSADGSGYAFLAKQIIELDGKNPQIAARLITPLTRYRKYATSRQEQMRKELQGIFSHKLSADLYEIVSKSLS